VAAVRADLLTLRARPLPAAIGGAALLAMAAGLLVAYRLAPVPQPPVPRIVSGAPGAGPLVVYEYSDYLCPYCARMHLVEKTVSASSPGVRFVRRHYPLDAACNPRIRETIHAGSCELARGGICAERLGAFEAYDDAAFANQDAKPTPQAVASMAGLDLSAFEACLRSPSTDARLAADVQGGMAAGVRATPSFQVQGKLYAGQLPPILGGVGAGGE
jgi:protein-disulfide isomerase